MSERALRTALLAVLLLGAAPVVEAAMPDGPVYATVETDPVLSESDAADDIAIWPHPDDPSLSLVIGTDKRGDAVEVYDMAGRRIQRITDGRSNGVDLRRGFPFGGDRIDLVAVGGQSDSRFYRVDPEARRLVRLDVGSDGSKVDPNGLCLYQSAGSGRFYLFGINLSSVVEQSELRARDGRIDVIPVRSTFDVGSDAEACVADDDLGHLYVNEADVALWKYGAEPGAGTSRRAVDRIGSDGHLKADVEGLTLVYLPGGDGYLLASSQGDGSYTVYRRGGDNAFLRKFQVESHSKVDGTSNTDGIDAYAGDLGPGFRHGVFIAQDHHNGSPASGNQNFKYVPLERVVDLDGAPATTTTSTSTTSTSTTTTTTLPPTTTTLPPTTTTTTTVTAPPVTSSTTVTTSAPRPSPTTTTTTRPPSPPAASASIRSGYWMTTSDGRIYAFGDAPHSGDATSRLPRGAAAVDLEPNPGGGYWVLDSFGGVHPFGAAWNFGDLKAAALGPGEEATSLSATPSGQGYWIFTSRGRAAAFGDADDYGDMAAVVLNSPVLDSIATPSGRGYYMVAGDGGIFSFGDARFFGSMGGRALNAPVQSLVPDPDGAGYWLVAADGGIFAFDAPFRGSMGGRPLNAPVTGMVAFGDGYLMVATDGGIFNFSDRAFAGSLGGNPPEHPVVAVASH